MTLLLSGEVKLILFETLQYLIKILLVIVVLKKGILYDRNKVKIITYKKSFGMNVKIVRNKIN